jgi:hypothetical protein
LSCQGANAAGTAFVGIPNCSFDPTTGDVTLGAGLTVNSTDGITFNDNSIAGIVLTELGAGNVALQTSNSGIFVNASPTGIFIDSTFGSLGPGGTGPLSLTSAGGITATAQAYPTFPITAVDQVGNTFTIAGDETGLVPLQTSIIVAGSTGNNGTYTVSGAPALVSGNTVFTVVEAILNATADGTLTTATQAGVIVSSAGGISLTNNSASGIVLIQNAASSGITLYVSDPTSFLNLNAVGVLDLQAGTSINIDAPVLTSNGNPILTALVGTTSAIGGSALTLGQQATGIASITGASAAVAAGAVIQATPISDVGDGFVWTASLTATDIITVKVLCLVAGTPTSTAYNVKVF